MNLKSSPSVVALLGDVVNSRAASDRVRLHRGLVAGLVRSSDGASPLRVTVGDEFQGTYGTLGAALDAAFRIRIDLLPDIDVRIGLGRGPVVDLDVEEGLQDGPGWWAAREAIEDVERSSRGTALRQLRTGYRWAAPSAPPSSTAPATGERSAEEDAVNAALACRDQLVGSLSDRGLRVLAGLLGGASQADLAKREGVSASAVSQQVRSQGIGAILHAHELVRRLP